MAKSSIDRKLEQLAGHLAHVARLANEIQGMVEEEGCGYEEAQQFFYEARLDMPYEFDLNEAKNLLAELLGK